MATKNRGNKSIKVKLQPKSSYKKLPKAMPTMGGKPHMTPKMPMKGH